MWLYRGGSMEYFCPCLMLSIYLAIYPSYCCDDKSIHIITGHHKKYKEHNQSAVDAKTNNKIQQEHNESETKKK